MALLGEVSFVNGVTTSTAAGFRVLRAGDSGASDDDSTVNGDGACTECQMRQRQRALRLRFSDESHHLIDTCGC